MRKMQMAIALLMGAMMFLELLGGTVESRFTGRIWYVDQSVSASGDGSRESPLKTIGEAVGKAANDDRVSIAAGEYASGEEEASRVYCKKRLWLHGAGRGKTIILGGEGTRCLLLSGMASGTIVEGVTLSGGRTDGDGAGVSFTSAAGTCYLVDSTIEDCVAGGHGGAVAGRLVLIRTLIDRSTSSVANRGAVYGIVGAYNSVFVASGRADETATYSVIGEGTYGPFVNCTFAANQGAVVPTAEAAELAKYTFYNTLFSTHVKPAISNECSAYCSATTQSGTLSTENDNLTLTETRTLVSPLNDWRLRTGTALINSGRDEYCKLGFIPEEYRDTDYYGERRFVGTVDIGAAEGTVEGECATYVVDATVTENAKMTIDGRPIALTTDSGENTANGFYISAAEYPTKLKLGATLESGEEIFGFVSRGYANFPDMNGATEMTLAKAGDVTGEQSIRLYIATESKYVSPSGNDSAAGTKAAPFKTLQAAVDKIADWGVIHAAAGIYSEGGKESEVHKYDTINNKTLSRVVITKPVKLIGDNGAKKTVIMGQHTDNEGNRYDGCGSNACRAVQIVLGEGQYACVQGFTLTGGATAANPTSELHKRPNGSSYYAGNNIDRANYGGGAFLCGTRCTVDKGYVYGTLQDSIVISNVAYWGAATYGGIVKRCLITGNSPVTMTKDSASTCINYTTLYSHISACAFYNNRPSEYEVYGGELVNCTVENAVSALKLGKDATIVNSIYNETLVDDSSIMADLRDADNGDLRPVTGGSAVTAGSAENSAFALLATTDIAGNEFDYEKVDSGLPAGCYYLTTDGEDWYVDSNNGSDSNNGKSASTAKYTLNAALKLASYGDTVHVAEGIYRTGEAIHSKKIRSAESVTVKIPAIAIVPKGVRLVADGEQEKTIIEGKIGGVGGQAENDYWTLTLDGKTFGEDAIRGLVMYAGARVKGFTIRNCGTLADKNLDGTTSTDEDNCGAGILAEDSIIIEDCFFTNCVSRAETAFYGAGTARRCKFIGLYATAYNSVAQYCSLYDSVIDHCYANPVGLAKAFVNCTMGTEIRAFTSKTYCAAPLSMNAGGILRNSMMLAAKLTSNPTKQNFSGASNCVFSTACKKYYTISEGSGCVFMDAASLGLDAEYKPETTESYVVDAGENAGTDELDLAGKIRIMNGKVDIGAYEYDYLPTYQAEIEHGLAKITSFSEGVKLNDAGELVMTGEDAQMKMTWAGRDGVGYRGKVTVTGLGVLKVYDQDGWLVGRFTAADGESTFTIEHPSAATTLDFVYEGGENDAVGKGVVMGAFDNFGGVLLYSM